MKYITLEQPWASMVCYGIMDVADAGGDLNYRGRVLVVSTGDTKFSNADGEILTEFLNSLPLEWVTTISNAFKMGNLPDLDQLRPGEIVGCVEITDCVDETYSMWDSGSKKKKWRLSNPRYLKEKMPAPNLKLLMGETSVMSMEETEKMSIPEIKTMKYDKRKLRIPLSRLLYEIYEQEYNKRLDLYITNDIETCGIFPDLSRYDVDVVDVVELYSENDRQIFEVDSIEAGVVIDEKGEEINVSSVYGGKEPLELMIIRLGRKKMWISR